MRIDCYGASRIGQRASNQDSIASHRCADGSSALIAVADGMGGYKGGDIASQLAIESLENALLEPLTKVPPAGMLELEEALLRAARDANSAIVERRSLEPQHARMGTTLTACLLQNSRLSLVHIGDSRCYRYRDGALQQLTEDHNLAQEMVRKKALAANQLESHPYSNVLTRALGVDSVAAFSHDNLEALPGDAYLLCSDGFFQVLVDDDITATLEQNLELQEIVTRLLDLCDERETSDNASLVMARLSD